MNLKIDPKSAAIGLLIGAAAMFTLGDTTQHGQNGRYQVSTGGDFVAVVDTQTGEIWGHPATTENQGGDKSGKFWDVKNN